MGTRKILIIAAGIVVFQGCIKKNERLKDCFISNLKFKIPTKADFQTKIGFDSKIYEIKLPDSNNILIQYGQNIYSLSESTPEVFHISEKDIILKNSKYPLEEKSMKFSETPEEDKKENIYSKNFYFYDTINGIACKIVRPKIIGNGMTGLFIRNLYLDSSICMYGVNLDSNANRIALKIFNSVEKESQ